MPPALPLLSSAPRTASTERLSKRSVLLRRHRPRYSCAVSKSDYFHSPLRYPGGKRLQLPQILKRLDKDMPPDAPFVEACVGGGSVFWAYAGLGRLASRRVLLNDKNPAVVDFYRRVTGPMSACMAQIKVLRAVAGHIERLSDVQLEIYYYQVLRADLNRMLNGARGSSVHLGLGNLFYVISRMTMNGLVRINQSGEFNVPIGRDNKKRPKRFTMKDVEILKKARGVCDDSLIGVSDEHCAKVIRGAPFGSVIYVDTPFSGGFVGYAKDGWTEDDDIQTFRAVAFAADHGGRIVMSQPATKQVRRFCKTYLPCFKIDRIMAPRSVNRDGAGRAPVGELLIWNNKK